MGRKFKSTGTVTLAQNGDNTVIAALASGQEAFIRRLWFERVDTTDVTIIVLNTATPAREIFPHITLNSDAGKAIFEFNDETEIGCGGGLGLVMNVSVQNKARTYVEYRIGKATDWPA